MRRIPEKIVRIGDTGLTLHYLRLTKKEKKIQAEKVIRTSFETMRSGATLAQKVETTTGLLKRSVKVLEEEESYEECQILQDLIEAIPRVYATLSFPVLKQPGSSE